MKPMTQSPRHSSSTEPILAEITDFLHPDLEHVRRLLTEVLDSESAFIREVGEYICLTRGKMLRPFVTLLSARAFGHPDGSRSIEIAAALEAIHVATLLHDDVIDKAALRRGKPSVNARWGDEVAILMADFLFAASFDLAVRSMSPQALQLLTGVTRSMCEGEMFQLERQAQWLTPDEYLYVISCKTARLFSACTVLGGLSAGLDPQCLRGLGRFGETFGMAFQITDDALDYEVRDGRWGKPPGIDLAEGKQTLPLILAYQAATEQDRARIQQIMNDGRDMAAIADILHRYGSFARCRQLADQYARQGADLLTDLRVVDQTAHDHLLSLARYVVARRY